LVRFNCTAAKFLNFVYFSKKMVVTEEANAKSLISTKHHATASRFWKISINPGWRGSQACLPRLSKYTNTVLNHAQLIKHFKNSVCVEKTVLRMQ